MVFQEGKPLNDQLNTSHVNPLHTVLHEEAFSLHGIIYGHMVTFDRVVFTLLAPIRMPQEYLK